MALASSPAFAHAVLLKSNPQDGQVFATAPKSVELVFDEPVQLTRLQAVRSDGTAIKASQAWPLTATIDWTLPDTLADGGWLLSYAVISSDSHPISGTIRFVVGDGEATFGEAPSQGDSLTEYPRFLLLAGALGGAGLLLAAALTGVAAQRRAQRLLAAALAASAVGGAGVILATAEAAGGGSVAMAAALNVLGPGLLVVMVALAAGLGLARSGRSRLAAVCGVAALIGLGLSGHVAGAPPAWLSRPVHLIHVAAAALWLGSLLVLLWRREPTPSAALSMAGGPASALGPLAFASAAAAKPYRVAAAAANVPIATGQRASSGAMAGIGSDPLRAFSRIAPWMVAALVVGGVGLLLVQAGNPEILIASQYGLMLAIKIAFVALLLALAAYNRWRLTRPALEGDAMGERRLRASIRVEVVLMALILAATALLGTTSPPRSLAAAAIPPCAIPGPVTQTGSDIGLDVTLTFQSACSGRNRIVLTMAWQDGHAVDSQEVMLRFSQPALDVEPFDVYLDGNGKQFSLANYDLPLAGEWRIETRILLDEYTLRRVVFRVPLSAPPAA